MEKYERFDSCYGFITDKNANGVYLVLDNNEEAYAHKFTSHKRGERVLCSIQKEASKGFRTIVSIDSVSDERELAS